MTCGTPAVNGPGRSWIFRTARGSAGVDVSARQRMRRECGRCDGESAPATKFTPEGLRGLRAWLCVAQEMAGGVGRGSLLLGPLPRGPGLCQKEALTRRVFSPHPRQGGDGAGRVQGAWWI